MGNSSTSEISSIQNEWRLLLAACSRQHQESSNRIRTLLCAPIQWNILLDLAERHGVLPLVCQALEQFEHEIPPQALLQLKQHFQINLHKAMFLSRELIRIVDSVVAARVEVLLYKGLALAETAYGDIALRQTGDIDLLIRARDLARVRAAVRELGYKPHSEFSAAEECAYLKSGYEYSFDGAAGPNLLEVQWAIQPRFYAVDFDMNELFEKAVTAEVAGRAMKTPRREDLFLILSVHAAKHVWGRLIWLCDLARIMGMDVDWKWIWRRASEMGIRRIVWVTMLLAERMVGTRIPDAEVPRDQDTESIASEIENSITADREFDVESIAYFHLMMRLRERIGDRVKFFARLAVTPGPGEWAAVRLPEQLFPLYRVVRVGRLLRRVVRR